eukprot:jgi/Astpho2/9454/e_gw1.00145.65.1_t
MVGARPHAPAHQQHPSAGIKRPAEAAGPGRHSKRQRPTMHPRNLYAQQEPDFAALSTAYPALGPHVTIGASGRGTVNFSDPKASLEVTRALLHADFGVTWELQQGQLVPPVANRANYIHWLEDLLRLSSPDEPAQACESHPCAGLDIGCGANCIYPLLGAAINSWRFVAVDVTQLALEQAAHNVALNPHLAHLITVRPSNVCNAALPSHARSAGCSRQSAPSPGLAWDAGSTDGILLPAVLPGETFSFSMCNPPFFSSMAEAGLNPSTAHGGTAAEMVYPGGELAFVSRMASESRTLGNRIHWYTTMVGKKATLKQLRKQLHAGRVTALRTTEFVQGKTSRWGVAWSFCVDPALSNKPLLQQ